MTSDVILPLGTRRLVLVVGGAGSKEGGGGGSAVMALDGDGRLLSKLVVAGGGGGGGSAGGGGNAGDGGGSEHSLARPGAAANADRGGDGGYGINGNGANGDNADPANPSVASGGKATTSVHPGGGGGYAGGGAGGYHFFTGFFARGYIGGGGGGSSYADPRYALNVESAIAYETGGPPQRTGAPGKLIVTFSTVYPDEPTGVTAESSRNTALVSWSEPESDGGTPVTGYTVTSDPAGLTCSAGGADRSCRVSGLTYGIAYRFTVSATNAAGTSPLSEPSEPVTAFTAPDPPSSVSAATFRGDLAVSFTPPAFTGGAPLSGFTVSTTTGDNAAWCSASPCTVTGLVPNASYRFVAIASNDRQLSSAQSAPSSAVRAPAAPTTPGPPSALSAQAQPGGAVVSFDAPDSDGGSAITGYEVRSSTGIVASCLVSPCTVQGLTNGFPVSFIVRALNQSGFGAFSARSADVTPASAPGEPAKVTVVRDGDTATVSWSAASSGGSRILSYTAQLQDAGSCQPAPATTLSCSVTGLNPLGEYDVDVTATNAVGVSTPGHAVLAPAGVPDAPGLALAVPSDDGNGVEVGWLASTANGASVRSYVVTGSLPGLSCSPLVVGDTHCTIESVPLGQDLTFSVTALNVVGSSAPAVTLPVRLSGKASVPLAPTFTAGRNSMIVSFLPPFSDGGSDVLGYRISLNGGGTWAPLTVTFNAEGGLSATLQGLAAGHLYQVRLQTVTGEGLGDANRPAIGVRTAAPSTPGPPVRLRATPGRGSIGLSWFKPVDDGGSPISGYRVSLDGGSTWTDVVARSESGGALSTVVTRLRPGRTYHVRIQARNVVGPGAAPRTPLLVMPR